ncbi:Aminoglycoside phosphotransferase [Gracilaria domingensis]|nr:Aminoglycoside phosphotransferase [Gracilaria domingensis]
MQPHPDSPSLEGFCGSDFESDSRQRFIILFPSEERNKVLVEVQADASVRLPTLPICGFHYLSTTLSCLENCVESFLGVRLRFVRELWATHKDLEEGMERTLWGEKVDFIAVLLMEWGEEPKSVDCKMTTEWMCVKELEKANWVETQKETGMDMKKVVLETMKEITEEMHIRMPPWRRIGWFTKILSWVNGVTQCDVDEHKLYRRFMKIVDNSTSTVWSCWLDLSKTEYSTGRDGELELMFCKAYLPVLEEGRITVTIAKVLKELGVVPEVISLNKEESVFMQRNGGSIELQLEAIDIKLLSETVSKMQCFSMEHMDELRKGGLKVRDSEWLYSNIHQLLHHEGLEKAVKGSQKYTELLRDIQSREEEVKEICRTISSYGIPNTLVHGDISEGNVGVRDVGGGRGYCFYDWGYAHIGQPFADINSVQRLVWHLESRCTGPMRREYWKHWMPMVNEEDFTRLLRLSKLMRNAVMLETCLREYEFHETEWPLFTEHLLTCAEIVRNCLDGVKEYDASREDVECSW